MRNSSSFHKSNLGKFGADLPCDLEGYVHTTARAWMSAPLEGTTWDGYSRAAKYAACKEMAREARAALRAAEAELEEWQRSS